MSFRQPQDWALMATRPDTDQRPALVALLHEPLLWFIMVGLALFASYESLRPDHMTLFL